jgi:hypothetical protein
LVSLQGRLLSFSHALLARIHCPFSEIQLFGKEIAHGSLDVSIRMVKQANFALLVDLLILNHREGIFGCVNHLMPWS